MRTKVSLRSALCIDAAPAAIALLWAVFLASPAFAADVVMPIAAQHPAPASSAVTARDVADEAVKADNALASIKYVSSAIANAASPADRRSLYAFLGSIQESLSLYAEALKSYSSACAIAAGDAEGMPRKSNEGLVLDAVRCALCSGDSESATRFLSTVAATRDPEVRSLAALYREWAILAAATSEKELTAPLARLRTYCADDDMQDVRAQILLTLWYVAGDNAAAAALKRDMPDSVEAAIVTGRAKMLPVPFWYFMVRIGQIEGGIQEADGREQGSESALASSKARSKANKSRAAQSSSATSGGGDAASKEDASEERMTHERIQLGLFRDKANATSLVSTLKSKGFSPTIATETRASGTVYYIVVIDHPSIDTEDDLRTAGFEFYPVF